MGSVSSTQKQVEKILSKYPFRQKLISKVSALIETDNNDILTKIFNLSSNPEKILFIFFRISHLFNPQILVDECIKEIEFPHDPMTLTAAIFYLTKNQPKKMLDLNLTSAVKSLNYIEKCSDNDYKTTISFILQGLINGLLNSSFHIKGRTTFIKNIMTKIDVDEIHYSGRLNDKCVILETTDYDLYFIDKIFKFEKDIELKIFKPGQKYKVKN